MKKSWNDFLSTLGKMLGSKFGSGTITGYSVALRGSNLSILIEKEAPILGGKAPMVQGVITLEPLPERAPHAQIEKNVKAICDDFINSVEEEYLNILRGSEVPLEGG